MTTNAYLVYWCNEGLESVVPITEYEHVDRDNTFRVLNNEDPVRNPLTSIIQRMTLRAKFNPDRHYELYAIDCEEHVTSEDLTNMFENNPQGSADLIRARGHQIYSDRVVKKKVKIV